MVMMFVIAMIQMCACLMMMFFMFMNRMMTVFMMMVSIGIVVGPVLGGLLLMIGVSMALSV